MYLNVTIKTVAMLAVGCINEFHRGEKPAMFVAFV